MVNYQEYLLKQISSEESEVVSERTVHNTSVGTEGDKWSWDSQSVLYVIKNHLKFSDKTIKDVANVRFGYHNYKNLCTRMC